MPAALVPPLQGMRNLPERHDRLDGIEQISIVTVHAAEMLSPQLQPQIAGEHPSAVAEAARVNRFAGIARGVHHRACDLGIVAPRSSIEIV